MRPHSLRLVIGGFGLAWGLASAAIYYRAGTTAYEVLLDLAIGWTYLYGGLGLWASRPANRTGRLMTLVGLTWFIGNVSISDVPVLHELGTLFSGIAAAAVVALILAYPGGRLETRLDRATVTLLAFGFLATNALLLLPVSDEIDMTVGLLVVNLALAAFAGLVVIRRWVVAPRRSRPELLPVLIAGSIQMAVLVTFVAVQIVAVPESLEAFLIAAKTLAPAAIPLALLVGFYRQSELRQRALLDAMPDAMIRLTTDGQYLDIRANEFELLRGPVDPMMGGWIHDLLPNDVAEAVLSGASKAIDTGNIQALDLSIELPSGQRDYEARLTRSGADEVTAVVRDFSEQRAAQKELRQSRARIVEATVAERRRLERDLHDGAQQRLVAVLLALRLTRTRLRPDVDSVALAGLDDAAGELKAALVELRELARGIHPAILTEAGLGPPLDSLATRSTVPAEVTALPSRRLPPAVESTAYFVVSEALANVTKYASATRVTVAADCSDDSLWIEVGDDGVGGADPTSGSGLRGLADRVAALGGRLQIDSPEGNGTRLVAEIPLAD